MKILPKDLVRRAVVEAGVVSLEDSLDRVIDEGEVKNLLAPEERDFFTEESLHHELRYHSLGEVSPAPVHI